MDITYVCRKQRGPLKILIFGTDTQTSYFAGTRVNLHVS